MKLYRDLSPEEIIKHQRWTRQHYVPFSDIKGIWHPVVQRECIEMNEEEAGKIFREEFLGTHMNKYGNSK